MFLQCSAKLIRGMKKRSVIRESTTASNREDFLFSCFCFSTLYRSKYSSLFSNYIGAHSDFSMRTNYPGLHFGDKERKLTNERIHDRFCIMGDNMAIWRIISGIESEWFSLPCLP